MLFARRLEIDVRELVRRRQLDTPHSARLLARVDDERKLSATASTPRTTNEQQARGRAPLEPLLRGSTGTLGQTVARGDVARPCSRDLDQEPVLGVDRRRADRLAGELRHVRTAHRRAHADAITQMT